jgi:hypothetical protein
MGEGRKGSKEISFLREVQILYFDLMFFYEKNQTPVLRSSTPCLDRLYHYDAEKEGYLFW